MLSGNWVRYSATFSLPHLAEPEELFKRYMETQSIDPSLKPEAKDGCFYLAANGNTVELRALGNGYEMKFSGWLRGNTVNALKVSRAHAISMAHDSKLLKPPTLEIYNMKDLSEEDRQSLQKAVGNYKVETEGHSQGTAVWVEVRFQPAPEPQKVVPMPTVA